MVSRKDFVATANLLARIDNDNEREGLIQHHIGIYGQANPRFNAKRFVDYINTRRAELTGAKK